LVRRQPVFYIRQGGTGADRALSILVFPCRHKTLYNCLDINTIPIKRTRGTEAGSIQKEMFYLVPLTRSTETYFHIHKQPLVYLGFLSSRTSNHIGCPNIIISKNHKYILHLLLLR